MIQPKTFDQKIYEMTGISKKTVENHLKLYEGYVKKYNEITEKLKSVDLSTANQTYSDLRELKVELTFALGGVRNHEIYFNHLGGKGGWPQGKLVKSLEENFGSLEKWKEDLTKTGLAARGWVWLAYDWKEDSWFNYLGDAQNTYPIWGASPALALDTYEHAYWADFGTDRASYIQSFFDNLNWEVIEKNIESWGMEE